MFDTANLDAIVQETRACFLYEDVPDYMAALDRDAQRLFGDASETSESSRQAVYTDLMRTAHSLKGGAAIAQLPHLSRLAHQLEDLLEALGQHRIDAIQPAHALLSSGIDRMGVLVAAAMRGGDAGEAEAAATLPIYDQLDALLQALPAQTEAAAMAEVAPSAPNPSVVKSALTVDLEECLRRVEAKIAPSTPPTRVRDELASFTEECLLLAQVLSLTWLSDLARDLQAIAPDAPPELPELAIATVAAIREQRDLVLVDMGASPVPKPEVASPASDPLADLFAEADLPAVAASDVVDAAPPPAQPDFLGDILGESSASASYAELQGSAFEPETLELLAAIDASDPTFLDDLPVPAQPEGDDLSFLDDAPSPTELPPAEVAEPFDLSQWDTGDSMAALDAVLGDSPPALSTAASELECSNAEVPEIELSETEPSEADMIPLMDAALGDLAIAPDAVGTADLVASDLDDATLEFLGLEGDTLDLAEETAALAFLSEASDVDADLFAVPDDVAPTLAARADASESVECEAPVESAPLETERPVEPHPRSVVVPLGRQSSAATQPPLPDLKLRMPVSRLDRIDNTLGELTIVRERLVEHHQQLERASRRLRVRAQQLSPINDRVREFYDRLAIEPRSATPSRDIAALEPAASHAAAESDMATQTTTSDFDALEFDRYTDFHSTLQDLQELMVQVQENRADIDLITTEFQSALDDLRDQLGSLRGDLRDSRFVPFRVLADPFIQPLAALNREHGKSVELNVSGPDTPIDQAIVEQLQAPLQHLFRNAFDHGIETSADREAAGKPAAARITLSAAIQGNQVTISVRDDGRGIDDRKVLEKAISKGLCVADAQLSPAQIYEFLFAAGFSTAASVSSLSGRGVGLDIVRLQIERLHGSIRIESSPGRGTAFILSIPLSLNIAPLLVCRCQQRTLALPSSSIVMVVKLSELERQGDRVIWQERAVPVYPLLQLLPYASPSAVHADTPLALIVDVAGELVAVGVDALVSERELVVKSFDATVAVPSYLMGCTVLGSGEVVPVIVPNGFQDRLASAGDRADVNLPEIPSEVEPTILIVDDSIAVRRMLDRILSASGYRVVQCRDGKEALEVLELADEPFHAAISDIEMPQLDGFGLLQEIRASDRWKSLPVAMLTSRENELHRRRAAELGATAYFTKPFKPVDLLQNVAEMVAGVL